MGLITNILTLPMLGGPKLAYWLARTISEQAEREFYDEGPLRGALMELQQRLDAGEIGEDDYDRQEKAILERLKLIREYKAKQAM